MQKTNITGNKGEWSEIYVLLKLLAEGKIHAADDKLKRIEEIYYPILKIIREEKKGKRYEYTPKEKVEVYLNDTLISEFDKELFAKEADSLFETLVKTKGSAFAIEQTEAFMASIGCRQLKAPSKDKTDITIQLHDIRTGFAPVCGFSIKSEIGSAPTLINAGKTTNFVFAIEGLSDVQIDAINNLFTDKGHADIKARMKQIFSLAKDVRFIEPASMMFKRNLMLIDSSLPGLAAYTMLYHYRDGISSCADIVNKLEEDNPMNYPTKGFYIYKFKKLLCSAALGMTPGKEWDGIDEANGGYIIVTSDGDVVAYHLYNRDYFEAYLLAHTKFERASTSRYEYASLYKADGKVFLNLNLQVRFLG